MIVLFIDLASFQEKEGGSMYMLMKAVRFDRCQRLMMDQLTIVVDRFGRLRTIANELHNMKGTHVKSLYSPPPGIYMYIYLETSSQQQYMLLFLGMQEKAVHCLKCSRKPHLLNWETCNYRNTFNYYCLQNNDYNTITFLTVILKLHGVKEQQYHSAS